MSRTEYRNVTTVGDLRRLSVTLSQAAHALNVDVRQVAAARRQAGDDRNKRLANDRYQAAFGRLLAALDDRIVPIDGSIAKRWGQMLGLKDKNRFDACLAATAVEHGMVVATRNAVDFERLGTLVLDPFRSRPAIRAPCL